MTGSIVLVMLLGWFACICLMIVLSSASSSRRSDTLTRRVTGAPVSPSTPVADSGER